MGAVQMKDPGFDSMVDDVEPFKIGGVSADQTAWGTLEDYGLTIDDLRLKFKRTMLWTVLVMPLQARKMSKGGIALPDQSIDAEQHMTYIGRVIFKGPLVGQSDRFKDPRGAHQYELDEGDWIIYGRYAGQPIIYKGVVFHTIYDDMVRHVINSPDGFKMYV